MIGPPLHSRGGIATVIQNIFATDFAGKNSLMHFSVYLAESGRFLMILFFLKSITHLLFLVLFNSVSIAHVHVASRGSYFRKSLVIRLLKLFRIKVILHLHGGGFAYFYANECGDKLRKHIVNTFMMVDRVIVLSSQWLSWANQTFPISSHFTVIHNTVVPLMTNGVERSRGSIVFLGRLSNAKGVDDLLHAFKLVKIACPEAVLFIAGDGDVENYKIIASDLDLSNSVIFLGWISGSEKIRVLESADVYCLPSYNEGFPMGVIEAMSIGIPVVSTFAGGIPDAITNGVDGLLVDAGDRDSLASALINIIRDRELNNRLSKAGKQKYDACFSQQAIIPKLQVIYDDLLTHKQ